MTKIIKNIVKILNCNNESNDTDLLAKVSTAEKLLVDNFFDTESAVESDTENSEYDLNKKWQTLVYLKTDISQQQITLINKTMNVIDFLLHKY